MNAAIRDVAEVGRYFTEGIQTVPDNYPVKECIRAYNHYMDMLFNRAADPPRRAARAARVAPFDAEVDRIRSERRAAENAHRRAAAVDALNAEIGSERADRNQPARQPREIEREPRNTLSEAEVTELSSAFAGTHLAGGRDDRATRLNYIELHNALTRDEKTQFDRAFVNSNLPFEFAVDARVWYAAENDAWNVTEIRSALAFMGSAIARDDTFMSKPFRFPVNDPNIKPVGDNLPIWFHRMPDTPRVDACLQAYNLYVIDRFEQGMREAQARADGRSRVSDHAQAQQRGYGMSN